MLDRTWKRVGHGREREVGGKRSGGTGKREEEEVNRDGQHVTEFVTMFAYEWYCITIIQIVNLPTEYEGMDQFMSGREDKQVKHHYYVHVIFSQKLD